MQHLFRPRAMILLLLTLAVAQVGSTCGGPRLPDEAIESFGLTELVPPSTLTPPGTYVFVRSWAPLKLGVVCKAEDSFGSLRLIESDSQDAEAIERKNQNVQLSGSYLKQVEGAVGFDRVKSIRYSLSNTKLLEADDAALFERQGQRSAPCVQALDFRYQQGTDVTMIKQVLRADVTYELDFDTSFNLSVEDKVGLIKGFAPKLGAEFGSATDHSLTGKALFWGVIDDSALACALAVSSCAKRPAESTGESSGVPRPPGVDPVHLLRGREATVTPNA